MLDEDERQWSEMADEVDPSEVSAPRRDRRGNESDRRYNRRSPANDTSPPYYAVFVRIADALEGIERSLTARTLDPSDREQDAASR